MIEYIVLFIENSLDEKNRWALHCKTCRPGEMDVPTRGLYLTERKVLHGIVDHQKARHKGTPWQVGPTKVVSHSGY